MYLTKKQSKKSCGHWYRSTQGFFFVYGFKNCNKNGPLRSCSDDTSSINIHMCSHLHLHLQAAADCVFLIDHNIIAGRYIRIGRMSIHSSCCDVIDPILLFMISYEWHGSLP
nr:MAG TPA: hypothetical protein [Caudoviricetes sp.]